MKNKSNKRNIIREYLDSNLLSMREFAKACAIGVTAVYRYTKGVRPSRLSALKIQHGTQGKIKISEFGFEN